jgi:Ca-activated chloride channel homolog
MVNTKIKKKEKELMKVVKSASEEGIYVTFIGIGLDFDTDLVEKMTKFIGCNYYSVNSKKEFKKILNEDFNYTVSPIVVDSDITIESKRFEIEKAYGTPFSNEVKEKYIKLGTQCASDLDLDFNGTKGGLILIKLKENKEEKDMGLKVVLNYKTVNEESKKEYFIEYDISEENFNEYYSNEAIQKGILLTRYVQFMKKIILR